MRRRGRGKPLVAAAVDAVRLRRLGLDDDAPLALVRALRRDVPALWLPEALACICAHVAAVAGARVSPATLLEEWGLVDPEEAAQADALRSVENLRRFAARNRKPQSCQAQHP